MQIFVQMLYLRGPVHDTVYSATQVEFVHKLTELGQGPRKCCLIWTQDSCVEFWHHQTSIYTDICRYTCCDQDAVLSAMRAVREPVNRTRSLYDFLLEYNLGEEQPVRKLEDRIRILGSGSDHSAFAFYAGVPAVYLRFEPDTQRYKGTPRSHRNTQDS
jgi:hypothetical protein